MPYDRFMESEGIPVYRGIGARQMQDLPLAPWQRLGGRGTYIQLYGTEGLWGSYVVEVPGAGALNNQRSRKAGRPGEDMLDSGASTSRRAETRFHIIWRTRASGSNSRRRSSAKAWRAG
jgi:hypothetical protein